MTTSAQSPLLCQTNSTLLQMFGVITALQWPHWLKLNYWTPCWSQVQRLKWTLLPLATRGYGDMVRKTWTSTCKTAAWMGLHQKCNRLKANSRPKLNSLPAMSDATNLHRSIQTYSASNSVEYGSFGHLDLFQKEDYKLIITVPFGEEASFLRTKKLYELSPASDNGVYPLLLWSHSSHKS